MLSNLRMISILLMATLTLTPVSSSAGEVTRDRSVAKGETATALSYSIYIPDAATDPERRFPVVYFLHGFGASAREWTGALGLSDLLDRMISAGEIQPIIAVMPDAGKSWYVDSADYGGPGDFESAIANALVAHVDRHYPTMDAPAFRAIAGLSMGGYGALRTGFKYPERFCAIAAFSAGVFKPGGISWQHGPGVRRWNTRKRWYGNAFGTPFSLGTYNAHNPFTYVANLAHLPHPPNVLLISGDDDQMGAYDGTLEMFLELRRLGLKPELRVWDGGHDHRFWRAMLPEALRFFDRVWNEGQDPT